MSWIKTINYEEAESSLKKMYDRVKGPNNNVDNILLAHSLRPHTLLGHMTLYKNVLHNSNNTLPKWYLEALGVYVSYLNACEYCFEHHYSGFKRLYDNDEKSEQFRNAVIQDDMSQFFEGRELAGARYAKKLTIQQDQMNQEDVIALRSSGFSDGEILEINQVVSYFNYANRTVVGLGVTTDGDILGLSPNNSNDPNNWNHD